MSIDGGTPVKHVVDNYQTTEITVSPATLDQIVFEYVNKAAAFDFDITNLKIATIEKKHFLNITLRLLRMTKQWVQLKSMALMKQQPQLI